MAKYSTGGIGDDSGDSCELCGAEGAKLREETVAGARIRVCEECAHHGDSGASSTSDSDSDRKRRKKAARNTARMSDASRVDSDWAQTADYDDDQLPYLVGGYGDRLAEARRAAGLQTDELAEELGADESDILAIEQGRATRAGVGGSLVADLEAFFDIELVEE